MPNVRECMKKRTNVVSDAWSVPVVPHYLSYMASDNGMPRQPTYHSWMDVLKKREKEKEQAK